MVLALVVTGVVLAALAGSALAHRLDVPAPLLLTVAGAVVAFVPFVPDLEISDELLLIGLLPPLLYAASSRWQPSSPSRRRPSTARCSSSPRWWSRSGP